jgi:hypothetical protein
MPKRSLQVPLAALEADIIETLVAGHLEWRPDLDYPQSHSDMQAAVRWLLRMYEVKRRPVAIELLFDCDACRGKGEVFALVNKDPSNVMTIPCPTCGSRE